MTKGETRFFIIITPTTASDDIIASSAEKSAIPDIFQSVNKSPTETGKVAWKTMAPVILPKARVSLPFHVQVTLLNFSGNSVATGARSSANKKWVHSEFQRNMFKALDKGLGAFYHHQERCQDLKKYKKQGR